MASRMGSRSSKDGFFRQYDYPKGGQKTEKPVYDRDNKRDVKMAALTNLLGNGITRLLGIRNLTYADLEKYAEIKRDQLGKVEYKKKETTVQRKSENKKTTNGGKALTPQEQLKKELSEHCNGDKDLMKAVLKQISYFEVDGEGKWIDDIDKTTGKWCNTSIGKLRKLEKPDPETNEDPLPDGVPKDCPKNPMSCEHSGWAEGKAFCGPDGMECPFQEKK